jgi:hypothetical protein
VHVCVSVTWARDYALLQYEVLYGNNSSLRRFLRHDVRVGGCLLLPSTIYVVPKNGFPDMR